MVSFRSPGDPSDNAGMNAIRVVAAGIATVALFTLHPAAAQYPARPVRIVVPFDQGTGADVVARAAAQALSARMGVAVSVDNIAGQAGATGTMAVAKAAPDGHTLLVTTNALTITPHTTKAKYDPTKDLVAVARMAVVPMVVVTSGKSRYKTFDELVAHLRANPDKATFATSGSGTLGHLEAEVIKRQLKLQARHVPQESDVKAIAATAGGQVDFFVVNLPVAQGQLKAGNLRALAVGSGARLPTMGNVPTLAEAMKRPGYEASVWYGMLAPAGTSSDVLTRLENEIERQLEVPEVRKRIESIGGRDAFLRSAPFGGQLRFEYGKWRDVVPSLKL